MFVLIGIIYITREQATKYSKVRVVLTHGEFITKIKPLLTDKH